MSSFLSNPNSNLGFLNNFKLFEEIMERDAEKSEMAEITKTNIEVKENAGQG